MTDLLDANVLIALTVADHVHHDAAEEWFEVAAGSFAPCPLAQGRPGADLAARLTALHSDVAMLLAG